MGKEENGDLRTDIITLTAHILQHQHRHPEASGDFSILLTAIGTACKWISNGNNLGFGQIFYSNLLKYFL